VHTSRTRKHQRGLNSWTLIGSLLIVAGLVGLGFTWFKPGTGMPGMAKDVAQASSAASTGTAPGPLAQGAEPALPGAAPTVSNAGLGDAKFGMHIDAVERALGRPLVLPQGKSKEQVSALQCSYAGLTDLAEVILRFEKGQFRAVDIGQPNVATRSGFKVGDPEKALIDKLKGDPTYRRGSSRYEDAIMEITVGKLEMVDQNGQQIPRGWLLKFWSEKGRITHIQAGAADYVALDEHDEDCER
jgi:hypothetical protein